MDDEPSDVLENGSTDLPNWARAVPPPGWTTAPAIRIPSPRRPTHWMDNASGPGYLPPGRSTHWMDNRPGGYWFHPNRPTHWTDDDSGIVEFARDRPTHWMDKSLGSRSVLPGPPHPLDGQRPGLTNLRSIDAPPTGWPTTQSRD